MEDSVAIVGCGLIGRAWAVAFARGGWNVALHDPQPDAVAAARAFADTALQDLARAGLLGDRTPGDVAGRITPCGTLAAALDGAGYVQESTLERLDLKIAVFRELDRLAAPQAVLASSTSALLPSAFTAELAGRERTLVVHPLNPPYVIPAVELVPAPWTAPATVERARAVMEGIGQAPVVMAREIDGFIVNRLQGALLHEAFRLVAEGYATTADVDRAVADGLGLRWSFMGPFETIDLNAPGGVTDYIARYGGLYADMARTLAAVPWDAALAARITAERTAALPRDALGERQAWRDRRLMALMRHKEAGGAIAEAADG